MSDLLIERGTTLTYKRQAGFLSLSFIFLTPRSLPSSLPPFFHFKCYLFPGIF